MRHGLWFSNSVIQWNVSFLISVQDWEVDLVIVFSGLLYSFRLRQGGDDRIRWIPSKGMKFEVRLFFHELSFLGGSSFL
jgi:hypothetical protein